MLKESWLYIDQVALFDRSPRKEYAQFSVIGCTCKKA